MAKKKAVDEKDDKDLSERAKDIALVSTVFPVYREMEIYPFVYQDKKRPFNNGVLPYDFYKYRKSIDYKNSFLEYYRPYYSYMVIYVNNLAFSKYAYNSHTLVDINRELGFHLEKIKIIDSLFSKGSLRDNLFRNAAYAYIFNIQEHAEYKDYFDKFARYNKDNEHKVELDKVFRNVMALQAGKIPPDFNLINVDYESHLIIKYDKIMTNKNMMKSKIALMGYTQKKLAEKIGMPVPTLTQKINNLLPFRTAEIDKIQKELNLTNDEVVEIFITGGK